MSSFNLSEWAVKHRSMVIFMMLAVLIGGIVSFNQLGRLEDPKFNLPLMSGVVIWPGANSEDVQNQVLNPIEQELQELNGFDYVLSFSKQGYGGFKLVVKGGMSNEELHDAWYQARKKINDLRQTLPQGVRSIDLNDEYSDVYSALYAIRANELSTAELNDYSNQIKRELQRVPQISKIDILGKQPEQIEVLFSSQRLAALGLSPRHIFAAIQQQNQLSPSGSLDTQTDRVFVRVDGRLQNVQDVEKIAISAGNRLLTIGDVATVRLTTQTPSNFKVRYQGEPAFILGVTMKPNGDILKFGQDLQHKMDEIRAQLPLGVDTVQIADQPQVVKASVWEFEQTFLEALAIVLLVCLLFLGWRTGVVVALSIPLVLGIVAMVMNAKGWNLDRISLGALIIALGLLVDDAIIAVEMMVVKLEQGWDRLQAATFAYTSTAFPMLTGTMVTIAGFMPVGFAKSTSGEYAGGIFWIVGTALIASWFVAVVFIPYLGVLLLPTPKAHQATHDPYAGKIYAWFGRLLAWTVRRRGWVLGSTAALFVLAIAGMGLVQQQFFPTASRPELLVELRMKEGASIESTENAVKRLEKIIAQDKDVKFFSSYIGASAPRFFLSLAPELPNASYAQLVLMTHGVEGREAVRARLLKLFDDNLQFPELRGRVARLEFGPPVGFPVQFRVIGPDTNTVRKIAAQVRDQVRQSALVKDTQYEWYEQTRSLNVRLDQDKIRLLGLSSNEVAQTVQAILSGVPISQIYRRDEVVDIVVRSNAEERQKIEQLGDINLFSASGAVVPLSQVASLEPSFEEPVLWRRNRDTILTVRADVADGVQAPYASQKIFPTLQPIIDQLPVGYRIEQGGALEESENANVALAAVFPVMILVMLTFLMMQLQSFSRMWMVFMTFPLGFIGVVPALLLFNAPFGFVALLGVIALGGMIMRNSVILVVQIDDDIRDGEAPYQAIINATIRRARPVILTAAAAMLAMLPLSTSIFWGPMAIAIMGGLLVATGLTLLFVPALYALWFKVQAPQHAKSSV